MRGRERARFPMGTRAGRSFLLAGRSPRVVRCPMSWPLVLNTTMFCNAKCKFCIVYDKLNRPELNMADEQVHAPLRQSRARGSTEVGYSGGEPSIDPRIIDFVRYAKEL